MTSPAEMIRPGDQVTHGTDGYRYRVIAVSRDGKTVFVDKLALFLTRKPSTFAFPVAELHNLTLLREK